MDPSLRWTGIGVSQREEYKESIALVKFVRVLV
jgi:hypothetical protein